MTKEMKAPPKKVGSARSNVYTTHFIRARLIILAPIPISPGLGLPFQKGRARVKFWFGRDNIWYCKVLYTTKFTRAEPFFWVRVLFLSEPVPKIFRSGFRLRVMITQTPQTLRSLRIMETQTPQKLKPLRITKPHTP